MGATISFLRNEQDDENADTSVVTHGFDLFWSQLARNHPQAPADVALWNRFRKYHEPALKVAWRMVSSDERIMAKASLDDMVAAMQKQYQQVHRDQLAPIQSLRDLPGRDNALLGRILNLCYLDREYHMHLLDEIALVVRTPEGHTWVSNLRSFYDADWTHFLETDLRADVGDAELIEDFEVVEFGKELNILVEQVRNNSKDFRIGKKTLPLLSTSRRERSATFETIPRLYSDFLKHHTHIQPHPLRSWGNNRYDKSDRRARGRTASPVRSEDGTEHVAHSLGRNLGRGQLSDRQAAIYSRY